MQEKIIVTTEEQISSIVTKAVNQEMTRIFSDSKGFQSEKEDLIQMKDAMLLTGLARQTLYGLCCNRAIPFIKRPKSRKLYFSRKALLEWLHNGQK